MSEASPTPATPEPVKAPQKESAGGTTAAGGNPPITDYRVPAQVVAALAKEGITEMYPIQAKTFDPIFDGKDIVARAYTGSGKTLGFALPSISKILSKAGTRQRAFGRSPVVICLCPVRELAKQVCSVFQKYGTGLSTLAVYGGSAYGPQLQALRRGVDVIVGTTGRIMDMIDKVGWCSVLISVVPAFCFETCYRPRSFFFLFQVSVSVCL
jgi:superfamily II DNA/RNA helicase